MTLPLRVPPSLVRYVVVGGSSFIADAGTLELLYHGVGAPLWVATTGGFWLSFLLNFLANKYFTFEVRAGGRRQMLRYGPLVGINYLANLAIVASVVAVGAPAVAGKTLAVGLLTVLNYFAYRSWVFKD